MQEWFVLGFFLIVVGIPVIMGIGGRMFGQWLKLREKQLELTARATAEQSAQYAAHVERLEQRMRVLERIAVDKGGSLALEIEQLRDERVN